MEEDKTALVEKEADIYNAADMPFDFIEEGIETALICEPDPAIREKIAGAMQDLGYRLTEAQDTRDALKKSRFHVYDVVILNECFDAADPDTNDLMIYFGVMPMATRREMFIALLTDRFRTLDRMAAFNKSVNLIINLKNMDDFASIFKKGLSDHAAFYKVFKESMIKVGKI